MKSFSSFCSEQYANVLYLLFVCVFRWIATSDHKKFVTEARQFIGESSTEGQDLLGDFTTDPTVDHTADLTMELSLHAAPNSINKLTQKNQQ